MALHGAKGEILFQKRTSPLEPPRERQGAFRLRPLHPLTTKREGRSPSFLDYPPCGTSGKNCACFGGCRLDNACQSGIASLAA